MLGKADILAMVYIFSEDTSHGGSGHSLGDSGGGGGGLTSWLWVTGLKVKAILSNSWQATHHT